MYFTFKKIKNKNKKGFSLIELIVVVAIFLIMTVAILLNQSKFSSDVLITNEAYKIALALREAQVFGIGSKAVSGQKVGYGAHFSSGTLGGFTLFTDDQVGGTKFFYDVSDPSSNGVTISEGQTLVRFCANPSGTFYCSDGDGSTQLPMTEMSIVFVKPNPQSHILTSETSTEANDALIVIASALGDKCRTIRITKLGQISVDPTNTSLPNGGCDVTLE